MYIGTYIVEVYMFWAYLLLIYVCIDAAAEFKKKERKKKLTKNVVFSRDAGSNSFLVGR